MEPWAFDSPAMRQLLAAIMADKSLPTMYIPVARVDDDLFTSKLLLRENGLDGSVH